MKFTGTLVGTVSGSIGGVTGSHNKGGQYFRRRAIPTNPGSATQTVVRNLMATYSQAWANTLTAAQRAGWDVYAANVAWIDSLGNSISLSGQQMYVRTQIAAVYAELPAIPDAPTNYTLAHMTVPVLSAVAATSVITVTFDDADEWANAVGGGLSIFCSRPQSDGISYFKGPYQYAGTIDGAASPPSSPDTSLSLPFAAAAGNKVFWQARAINADGRVSGLVRGSFLAS